MKGFSTRTSIFIIVTTVVVITMMALLASSMHHRYPSMAVKDVAAHAHTGDLLLFAQDASPSLRLESALRGTFWKSAYTHVGVLYIDPHTQEPYVWESNWAKSNSTYPDALTGTFFKDGCKLVQLSCKMRHYKGYCVLHRFQPSFGEILGSWDRVYERFNEIFDTCTQVTFHTNTKWMAQLAIASTFGWNTARHRADLMKLREQTCTGRHQMLCSELAVYTWWMLGAWRNDDLTPPPPLRKTKMGQRWKELVARLIKRRRRRRTRRPSSPFSLSSSSSIRTAPRPQQQEQQQRREERIQGRKEEEQSNDGGGVALFPPPATTRGRTTGVHPFLYLPHDFARAQIGQMLNTGMNELCF